MRELSLFSGIGGGVLGSKLCGVQIVGYVEKDEYCQRQLAQRITDGVLDIAPIFTHIGSFIREGYAGSYTGMVDIVSAGFPCQPWSKAGQQKEDRDSRNLWPETMEVVRIVGPSFVLLENVQRAFTSGYGYKIVSDLAKAGYDAEWRTLSAFEFGAHHIRKRVFLVAYAHSIGWNPFEVQSGIVSETVQSEKEQGNNVQSELKRAISGRVYAFPDTGNVGMVDDDAYGMERIKGVGNGQLPQVVQYVHEEMILSIQK